MKLEFYSECDASEISWVGMHNIPIMKVINHANRPTKTVLGLILLLEQGKFPILKVTTHNGAPLKESYAVHEAYLRCHVSVIPTLPVASKEEMADNGRIDYVAAEQEVANGRRNQDAPDEDGDA